MSKPPLLTPALLDRVGHDLHRPECVVVLPSGELAVSDWRGGVTLIAADGTQRSCLAVGTAGAALRPNGLAAMADGSFLIANLGDAGGVWRLHPDGRLEPFLLDVAGATLPPANFVFVDHRQRVWISVSTRHGPRQLAWREHVADGFIVLVDSRGARIVVDKLHYTNEVRLTPSGDWLYVVETFGRRIVRFKVDEDGVDSSRAEIVCALAGADFPDGFAFDRRGRLWLTTLVTCRLLRVAPDGHVDTILEDVNPAFVAEVERAFSAGEMRAEHLGHIDGVTLQQLTSVAFGGRDGESVYLGTLHAPCVFRFDARAID